MLEGIRHLNPSEFAEFYFDFIPYDYQKEALDCTAKNVELVWGRQTGKTTITALRGLYEAIMHDDYTVMILAPTQRQSSRLFRKIKNFITKSARKHPELKLTEFIERETMTIIEFQNGSEIISLPISEDGSNIRGFTANFQIIDECGELEKMEVWSAINPMTMTTGGGQWLIGTLRGTNNQFYNIFKDPKLYEFKLFMAVSTQNPVADKKKIELDRLRMPEALWLQEYMNMPMEEYDAFFPYSLVKRFFGDYLQHEAPVPNSKYEYYLGVDPAGEGLDKTGYCIICRTPLGRMFVAKIFEIPHQTLPQIEANIRLLHTLWNFKKIEIDCTGGRNIHEMLIKDGVPAEGFQFTIQTKEEAFQFSKQNMQGGDFTCYESADLNKQLLDMKYEPIKIGGTGHLKIYAGQSKSHNLPGGDDLVTALVLALWATKLPPQPVLFGTAKSIYTRGYE